VVVEITTDTGVTGWGESCPFGLNYLEGFGGGALAALEELCPLLIGRNPLEIDAINWFMDATLTGHIYAKSAIDIACWDILGKTTGLPLYTLLGGMTNKAPLVRTSVNAAEGDLAAGIEAKRRQGFQVLPSRLAMIRSQTLNLHWRLLRRHNRGIAYWQMRMAAGCCTKL
jgi:L-alanine-DL-glutamate epimerase-like enolase superfamily enzyme